MRPHPGGLRWLCAAVLLLPTFHVTAQTSDMSLKLTEDVTWSSLPANLFGYNTNVPATAGGRGQTTPWDDPRMVKVVDELAPSNMRFPGGTLSQFYDWRTQRQVPPHPLGKATPKFMFDIDANQAGFMRLCEQLNMRPVFVFNTLTDTVDSQWQWIESLAKSDGSLPIKHWEVGNEVDALMLPNSDFKHYKGPIQSPEDYITYARDLGNRIHSRWPEAQVAVVGGGPIYLQFPGGSEQGVPEDSSLGLVQWNQKLSADRSFYDAVVYHIYLQSWPQFQHRLKWTPQQRMQWLLGAGDAYPGWLKEHQQKYYGTDKAIWLTEVGMVTWVGNREHKHSAEFAWWSRLAEINFILALIADHGPIEMICKHLLAAPSRKMPVMVIGRGEEIKRVSLNQPLAQMFAHIGQATRGDNIQVADLPIEGVGQFKGRLKLHDQTFANVRAIAMRRDSETTLFLINRSAESARINLPHGSWQGETFVAELEQTDEDVQRLPHNSKASVISLPAYSYTVLRNHP